MSARVIKFRGWSYTENVWLYPATIEVWDNTGELKAFYGGEYSIEQFTGLYDRDGEEIWEGDILQSDNVDYSPVAVVVYVDYEARFAPCEIEAYLIGKRDGDLFNQPGEPWMVNACRVIGNVHEHPNLLDKETKST